MKTKQFLTLVFLSSILCSSIIEAQPSKENFEFLPYFKFYSYSWREFGDDGKELLNESGPVFGFGAVM